MPTEPVMDEGGPTMEHSGKALLRHIDSKSPKPMIIMIIISLGIFAVSVKL